MQSSNSNLKYLNWYINHTEVSLSVWLVDDRDTLISQATLAHGVFKVVNMVTNEHTNFVC